MIRAELMKMRTVGSTWVALAVAVGGLLITQILLVTVLPAIAAGSILANEPAARAELGPVDSSSAGFQYGALDVLGASGSSGSIGIATIAVLALGLIVGTTDFRHGGILGAALARPARTVILGGKVAATAIVAALLGLALAAVSLAVLLSLVAFSPAELALQPTEIASSLGRGVIAVVLLALLGLAVGVLVRGQITASILVAAVLVGEPILQGFVQLVTGSLPVWAQFLPLSLARAGMAAPGEGELAPLTALAALAALVGIATAAAAITFRRRDL